MPRAKFPIQVPLGQADLLHKLPTETPFPPNGYVLHIQALFFASARLQCSTRVNSILPTPRFRGYLYRTWFIHLEKKTLFPYLHLQLVSNGLRGGDHVRQRGDDLLPLSCFQTAIGVDPQPFNWNHLHGFLQ